MPTVKKIAGKYYKELKGDLPSALDLAEELIKTQNLTVSDTRARIQPDILNSLKEMVQVETDTMVPAFYVC